MIKSMKRNVIFGMMVGFLLALGGFVSYVVTGDGIFNQAGWGLSVYFVFVLLTFAGGFGGWLVSVEWTF